MYIFQFVRSGIAAAVLVRSSPSQFIKFRCVTNPPPQKKIVVQYIPQFEYQGSVR